MAIFDFLLGTPAQTQTVFDPRTVAARDMLLDRILAEMDRGPINVPTYFAPTPQQRYSGANSLLASLGLETVNPSLSLPTQDVGGVQAYSTGPLRDQIMEEFKAAYPELYEQLTNPQPVNTQVESQPVTPRPQPTSNDDNYFSGGFGDDPGPSGTNSLITGGPSAASRQVFADADLYGNHGGSHLSKIADDISTGISNYVSGGGIFGAIKNAFSNKNDDPSIGNVP